MGAWASPPGARPLGDRSAALEILAMSRRPTWQLAPGNAVCARCDARRARRNGAQANASRRVRYCAKISHVTVTNKIYPIYTEGQLMKWVTRERPKVDRIACPWLIKRFVDPEAEFLYVPGDQVSATADHRDLDGGRGRRAARWRLGRRRRRGHRGGRRGCRRWARGRHQQPERGGGAGQRRAHGRSDRRRRATALYGLSGKSETSRRHTASSWSRSPLRARACARPYRASGTSAPSGGAQVAIERGQRAPAASWLPAASGPANAGHQRLDEAGNSRRSRR